MVDGQEVGHQAPAEFVKLDVTHSNLEQSWQEIRFLTDLPILSIKKKLMMHGGSDMPDMELYLRGPGGDEIFMDDDKKTLADYKATAPMSIHIKDTNPNSISAGGALEDVGQVKKFELSAEAYAKRGPGIAEMRAKAGAKKKAPPPRDETEEQVNEWAKKFVDGARCLSGGNRGVVKFFGALTGQKGSFVGVELDEPLGKNDGAGPDGTQMFTCDKTPKYGSFVRPEKVEVGDFPVVNKEEDEI